MSELSREGQNARWFPSVPQWLIPWSTRLQVWVYEKTRGLLFTRAMRMHHLLLYTVGRRTGQTNTCCLPYWVDAGGRRVIVASLAGAPRHPAWFHNLSDSHANPEVRVRDKRSLFWARADVLEGEDRARTWTEMIEDRPFYADYQTRTEREIPLVRLVETRPDTAP